MTDRTSRTASPRPPSLRQRAGIAPAPDAAKTAVAHAQAAKVLTTGVSVSMVLGIVAYMSHSVAVEERIAREQALQAQQATTNSQAAAAATSVPMVALTDGTLVGGSTLVPGAIPTAAQTASGGTIDGGGATGSVTGTTLAGTSSGDSSGGTSGGTVTTVASGVSSGGSSGGGSATTQPPVTQAPTTTVPVTVAPTTTVSGGTTTSH